MRDHNSAQLSITRRHLRAGAAKADASSSRSASTSCSGLQRKGWVEHNEVHGNERGIGGRRIWLASHDSARQETDHAFEQSAERWANGVGEIEPALLEYALCMAQSLEAFVAVVGAHTARSDAAKRNVLLGIMQVSFVD